MQLKRILSLFILLTLLCTPAWAERIICASTTSTQNSGLLEHILPLFKASTGIDVHIIAVGTGAALEIGKRGDADVVLVHARALELKFVEEGYFTDRKDIMYNDFVILGPREDPAKIRDSHTAAEAFRAIKISEAPFISRGDNSGTHMKELSIWATAGGIPKNSDWYLEVGQGMSKTQRIANEKRAYTLTDRGTWLSKMDSLDMTILFEGDPAIFNQYGAMAVNPKLHKHTRYNEAIKFINWLTSPEGQKAINEFKISGKRLFKGNSE
ncbi:substrate-binding domain-containing protein [Nitrospirota bacterium]